MTSPQDNTTSPTDEPVDGEVIDEPGTDVEIHVPRPVAAATADDNSLDGMPAEWVAAGKLTGRIASTTFVPKAIRGDRPSVFACILTGGELGLGPMQSLRMVHVVDGRPTLSAELMRALANQRGHRIDIDNTKQDAVTLIGTRKDTGATATVTWTLADARAAGLAGKDVWKKYPRAMLLARATSELCRALFPDVIGGLYTPEEAAEIEGGTWEPAAGELVDPVTRKHVAGPNAPTEAQTRHAFGILGRCGITDRDHRLGVLSVLLERPEDEPVESWNDLTRAEATRVIDQLVEIEAGIEAGALRVDVTDGRLSIVRVP